jgi:transposase InsO family protein
VCTFLHRIHVDLVGPLPTGLRGNQYFLKKIKEFKSKYENLTEKRLKVIRADRGTEFISKAIDSWNSEQRILMEYSAVYVSAKNGRAERTNRTIVESTRSIMK